MNDGILQDRNENRNGIAIDRGQNESRAMVLAAEAGTLVRERIRMAKEFKRSEDEVRERLLKECRRPSFAEIARYHKPVGKGVEGLSIRFAEEALRIMTNMDVQQTVTSEDDLQRTIAIRVLDMESNNSASANVVIEKTVERSSLREGQKAIATRKGSRGQTVYIVAATEDDLQQKQNAQVSKAIRTEGLRLIPAGLREECEQTILATMRQKDKEDPDAAKRKVFDSFGTIGVPVEQLKLYLGHDGTAISPKELSDLRAIFASMREEELTWHDVIAPVLEARRAAKEAADKARTEKTSGSRKGNTGTAEAGKTATTTGSTNQSPLDLKPVSQNPDAEDPGAEKSQ